MHYLQVDYLKPTRGYGQISSVKRDLCAFVFSDQSEQNDLFTLMQRSKQLKICCVLRKPYVLEFFQEIIAFGGCKKEVGTSSQELQMQTASLSLQSVLSSSRLRNNIRAQKSCWRVDLHVGGLLGRFHTHKMTPFYIQGAQRKVPLANFFKKFKLPLSTKVNAPNLLSIFIFLFSFHKIK